MLNLERDCPQATEILANHFSEVRGRLLRKPDDDLQGLSPTKVFDIVEISDVLDSVGSEDKPTTKIEAHFSGIAEVLQLSRLTQKDFNVLTPQEEFSIMQRIHSARKTSEYVWGFFLEEKWGYSPQIGQEILRNSKRAFGLFATLHPGVEKVYDRPLIKNYPFLKDTEGRIRKHLQRRINADTTIVPQIVSLLHNSEDELVDEQIDWLMGIVSDDGFEKIRGVEDIEENEVRYEGSDYGLIRDFIHEVRPKPHDVVYDVGSGYGRVVLYGALTTDAFYKGIEFITERVLAAERARRKNQIKNAEFINQNFLDVDVSDGAIFFINLFPGRALEAFAAKLADIAKKRPLTIVSHGQSNTYLGTLDWLSSPSGERNPMRISWNLTVLKSL